MKREGIAEGIEILDCEYEEMSLEELQQEFNDELGNDEEVVNEKLKQKKY